MEPITEVDENGRQQSQKSDISLITVQAESSSPEETAGKSTTNFNDAIPAWNNGKERRTSNDEEANSEEAFDEAQALFKSPVPAGSILDIGGREVILAIAVFFTAAICVALIAIMASERDQNDINKLLRAILNVPTEEKAGEKSKEIESGMTTDDVNATTPLPTLPSAPSVDVGNCMICQSRACLLEAVDMLDMADLSARPCNNFWQFACGGWLARNTVMTSPVLARGSWGVDDELRKKVDDFVYNWFVKSAGGNVTNDKISRKKRSSGIISKSVRTNGFMSAEEKALLLYKKCMLGQDLARADDISPLVDEIDKFGGWAIMDDWNIGTKSGLWNFQKVLSLLHFTYKLNPLLRVSVGRSRLISDNRYFIQIDQDGLGLLSPDYYGLTDDNDNSTQEAIATACKEFMRRSAELYGSSSLAAEQFANDTWNFEWRLAKLFVKSISCTEVERRKSAYENVTVAELKEISPRIDWLAFLGTTVSNLNDMTTVLVQDRQYLSNLSSLLDETDQRVLNYYLVWQLIRTFSPELSSKYREELEKFQVPYKGKYLKPSAEENCIQVVTEWMGKMVDAIFVRNYFTRQNRENVVRMVMNMENLVQTRINVKNNRAWFGELKQEEISDKMDKLDVKVGFPDFLIDTAAVNEHYKYFDIHENDTYFGVLLKARSGELRRFADNLNHRTIRADDWDINVHEVNAIYHQAKQEIILSAGLLQPPFFRPQVPEYVNYGAIGSIIGHELAHAIDGCSVENFQSATPNSTTADLWQSKLNCLEKFYSSFKVEDINVNGATTLDENLADIQGLSIAYRAYKRWENRFRSEARMPGLGLTNDQAFFLSYGQSFCKRRTPDNLRSYLTTGDRSPEEIRIRGALSQFSPFSEAFNCPIGSAMRLNEIQLCNSLVDGQV